MENRALTLKFWGVRGSLPTPLTPAALEAKITQIVRNALITGVAPEAIEDWLKNQPRHAVSTYGGNTSCIELRADGRLVAIDMGSGMRELGNALMSELLGRGSLDATVLVSHVHWDHIQGFPFFGPIYVPRGKAQVNLDLWGGVNWRRPLKSVLAEQMSSPMFPMDFKKVEQEGAKMRFHTVNDRLTFAIPAPEGDIRVLCRRLNHPQETYGFRFEYCGRIVAYCTDNEDFPIPDPALVELVTGADVWIQDCQYDNGEYKGEKGGPPKLNWGHSEPEYVGRVAALAHPKLIITFHHDPQASDAHIAAIASEVRKLSGVPTEAAYEGKIISV